LEVLLWLLKNIWLLSSPFLLDGYKNFTQILQIQHPLWEIYTTTSSSKNLSTLFDIKAFKVEFGEGYVY
jgi:hypothetical protein